MNNNPTTYKDSPLGKIPSDWEVRDLGEVIDYRKGFAFKTNDYQDKGVRIIRVSDTNANGIKTEGNVFIESTRAKDYVEYELKQNDIIIQTVGSRPPLYDSMVGKTILVDKEYEGSLLNQNSVRIRTINGSNIFLFANLKTKRYLDFIETLVRGNANQVSITLEDLFKFKVLFPTNPEQRAIASVLSTMDEVINKNNQLIAQKELRKKWLMQQLLTGKKRLKGFEKEKWNFQKISSFAKEVSIKNKEDKALIVLSCTKYDGLVPSLEYFGRKIYSDDLTTYKIVPKSHFAYATNHIEEGSIGYQAKFDETLISPMYTVFKTDGSVDDVFLYRVLKSQLYIHEYKKRMEGSIDRRGGLRWDEFSKIKVPVLSIEEQSAISTFFVVVDKEIQLLKAKADKLKEQKKGLMQVLLTGKKRLKLNN